MDDMKTKFGLIAFFSSIALAVALSACSSSGSSGSGTSDECTENPASPNCQTTDDDGAAE